MSYQTSAPRGAKQGHRCPRDIQSLHLSVYVTAYVTPHFSARWQTCCYKLDGILLTLRARHANPRFIRLFRMIYAHQSSCFCHWINGNIFTQLVTVITHSPTFMLSASCCLLSSLSFLLTIFFFCTIIAFLPVSLFTSHTLHLHYLVTFPLSLFHCHPVLLRCPLPSILPALFHQGSPNGVGQIQPAGRRLTSCTGANWSAR